LRTVLRYLSLTVLLSAVESPERYDARMVSAEVRNPVAGTRVSGAGLLLIVPC